MESPLDLPLSEDGETLVEPEVFKVAVGHEVPRPGVRDLVGDHVGVGLVSTVGRIFENCKYEIGFIFFKLKFKVIFFKILS